MSIKAYFRSGQEFDGEKQYSISAAKEQFRLKFPNKIIENTAL